MTDHYFSKKQASRPRYQQLTVTLRGVSLTLTTSSGIFSKDHIDKGTLLLIDTATVPQDGTLLDLGCGYGPVGLSIAKAHPKIHVTLTDVNERAVKLARKNARDNNLQNITTIQSDIYDNIDQTFDTILLNPPQTAGKAICQQMIQEAPAHLTGGGSLQIVARHNVGGKTLASIMKEVFGNMDVLAKKGGFRIYRSIKGL
ncbi:MAG: class I SAM-dependent methyltransferase [Nanobdellota archaeon]